MPYLNIHNPLDEMGRRRMQDAVDTHTTGGSSVADVVSALNTIPEIRGAPTEVAKLRQEFPYGKNLVISGHIASDVAGINPFIERLQSMGLTVTRVSGL